MERPPRETPPPRVERFFDALLARDGAGGSWLGPLLGATPRGRERLGELVERPGWLAPTIAVRTETGRRGAFEQPSAPSRRLLEWYIDHPDELGEPPREGATPETVRLRRALLDDEPAGARGRAQTRARELLAAGGPLGPAWWRFESPHISDCVLITDRLVVVVQARDATHPPPPATPWLPRRSALVRELEAARRLGESGEADKAWGVLVLGDAPELDAGAALAAEVQAGAPHLDAAEQRELADGFLGSLAWEDAELVAGPPASV